MAAVLHLDFPFPGILRMLLHLQLQLHLHHHSLCALLYANAIKISTMQTFTSVATNVVVPPAFCPRTQARIFFIESSSSYRHWSFGRRSIITITTWQHEHLPGHTSATIWRFALVSACLAIIV